MGLSPGTKLGAFEVAALIGKGGMGEVYRARDTKLGRDVAIKVLPEAFADKPERLARFEREAQMLAALDHPNVGALYEFRHEDGIHFLVMQLVEGDTLSDRIGRGPMSVRDALPIFAQIAEALEAAHERGIIHRDLKPANIKVSRDGAVKVLDFGLAKPLEPGKSSSDATTIASESPTKVTTDGTILGTPSYMSPEQARGQEVDKRADIWAFGCCFYEALTGRVPFEGDTVSDTIAAILEREPDYEALSSTLPDPILRLLRRALKKDVRNRLRDIGDARIELQELVRERERAEDTIEMAAAEPPARRLVTGLFFGAAGFGIALVFMLGVMWLNPSSDPDLADTRAVLEPIRSLVVLPFTNLSGDAEQEYFVDGMTEALIAELAKIRALKVISRTSTMSYKDTDKSIPEIVRELNVDGVIEGSVYRSGNEVRITAQLIHGATDEHLWAENYEGTLAEALKLQGEVALAIAHEIEVAVTAEDAHRVASIPSVNPEAHDAFLRGKFFLAKRSEEGFKSANTHFLRATEIDPEFALAYAGLADANALVASHGYVRAEGYLPKAKAYARKAIELNDNLAEAHSSLAWATFVWDWDWEGAERGHKRALELDPSFATGHQWYAMHLALAGRHEEALSHIKKAVELDPLSLVINWNYGDILAMAGDLPAAERQMRRMLELDDTFVVAHRSLAWLHDARNEFDAAARQMEIAYEFTGRPHELAYVAAYRAALGRNDEARALLKQVLEQSEDRYIDPFAVGKAYWHLGNKDRAFEWILQIADDHSFTGLYVAMLPAGKPIRDDPRFNELLRRVNHPLAASN